MRLLIVNGNTSPGITDIVAGAARVAAAPATELSVATGGFGARVIASRAENAVANHAILDAIAGQIDGCDGVLIAVSYDTGLDAARELYGLPVLGMTEAALMVAATVAKRIGVIVWGSGALQLHREVVTRHGFGDRLCGARRVDLGTYDADPKRREEDVLRAALDLVETCEAEAVVLLGAVFAGCSSALEARVPVPVLDGVRCGVPLLEALVRVSPRRPAVGSFALRSLPPPVGLSHALTRLVGAKAEPD